MTEVSLTQLSKHYPDASETAVQGLTLDIPSGSLTALLGPSGCGKTTVMKMIAGLLEPSSGDIRFDGTSVLNQLPEQRDAVMVFQNHLLFPYMSVADNVGFGLRMRGLDKSEISRRVSEILDLVNLPDMENRRPSQLSGGQQQRVALARALVVEPKVLLLDEPLSNLDAHLRSEMRDLIARLHHETGITTLLVTHDQEEAVVLADNVALLLNGQLHQTGTPRSFYDEPATEAVARFFGGQNLISGEVSGGTFKAPGLDLTLPEGFDQGPGVLSIRPENINLHPTQRDGNKLVALIKEVRFQGTHLRVTADSLGTILVITAPPSEQKKIQVGKSVEISLPKSSLWIISET